MESLESWSPKLFLLAGIILLVAAANYAVAFLMDGVAFNYWVGLTVLTGRLVSLLAVGGLSVQIANRNPRLGKLSRVVVSVAIVFTSGLLTLAILENVGYSTDIIAIFGLGTILLSLVTYSLFGGGIIRTGAYPTSIGVLLLAATGALLVGFFSQMVLPERLIGVIGTVAEGGLFITHIAIGYRLWSEPEPTDRGEPAPDPVAK
jgi:hypothetical protein